MLYYILFWTLLGFIIHFYIIFGTNLLTGGPTQNCCFLPILVFRRNGISNGVQTEWNLRERDPENLDPTSRKLPGSHEVAGRTYPLGRALHPRGPHVTPLTYSFLLYIPTYPQTKRYGAKNLIPPPQLSVSMRSHLGACFGAPPEDGRHHGGLLHHPSPSDEVWVVYLRPSGP